MARILIIDDESNIRLMLRLALQTEGHTVEVAGDGTEGLERYGDGADFDLVLLDQRMPGMEGIDVLREIKTRQPAARVVMVTAFGTVDLAQESKGAGATDFLRKPFTTDVLRGAVKMALRDEPTAPREEGGERLAVNGFRVLAEIENVSRSHYLFTIVAPDGERTPCEVLLPPFFMELVRAYADTGRIESQPHFWEWLAEEALSNYLWQNAQPPLGDTLLVSELTSGLKRWMDAVLI